MRLRVGTRGSALARRQTAIAIAALAAIREDLDAEVVPISTRGDADKTSPFDQIGGKGIFAHEIQRGLFDGEIDVAVHSLKDLTSAEPDGLELIATLERGDARDCLVSRDGRTLDALPAGAVVGTSSVRREALLRTIRPDLRTAPLRGNVDTRLRKVVDGEVDAAILAAAGIVRLDRNDEITEYLDPVVFVPSPGQGAIAIERRADRDDLAWIGEANDQRTWEAVSAERTFMRLVEGSCDVPLGAWARPSEEGLTCDVFVGSREGSAMFRDTERGADPEVVAGALADRYFAMSR